MLETKIERPAILCHRDNRAAFETLIREEAQKLVTRDTGQRVLHSAKRAGLNLGGPNVIAAAVGYAVGGPEGALEAMKDVSCSVLPYTLVFQTGKTIYDFLRPTYNINYAIGPIRERLTNFVRFYDRPARAAAGTVMSAAATGAIFAGMSLLTEKLTGIDFNQLLVGATGAGLAVTGTMAALWQGRRWTRRISDYTEIHRREIESSQGRHLGFDGLESLVRGALQYPDKALKIAVATSEPQYRDAPGGLAFLGALDALADKDRDPTRIKPNVVLGFYTADWGHGQDYPRFTFEHDRDDPKGDTIMEVASCVQRNGLSLGIHPLFDDVPLGAILESPFDHLSTVYIHGKDADTEHFQVRYEFNDDKDEVQVLVYSREHLGVLSDVFRLLYQRPIQDTDFDAELVGLSEHLETLAGPQIRRSVDKLRGLGGRRDMHGPSFFKEREPEEPEQPPGNLDELPEIVTAAYEDKKDGILPAEGHPALSLAFEGVVYSLSPMEYENRRARTLVRAVLSPVSTARSLISEREALPALREAELVAQMSGFTRENAHAVLREFDRRIGPLLVDHGMDSVDYNVFCEVPENPQLMADNAYKIDIVGPTGIRISVNFGRKLQSYSTIRDEYFPCGEVLEARAEMHRQARATHDYRKVGMFGMLGPSRFERELESPTYEASDQGGPEYLVLYCSDDTRPFMLNRTVRITTQKNMFIDTPVHLKEGVMKITEYLSQLRQSVEAVNSG